MADDFGPLQSQFLRVNIDAGVVPADEFSGLDFANGRKEHDQHQEQKTHENTFVESVHFDLFLDSKWIVQRRAYERYHWKTS